MAAAVAALYELKLVEKAIASLLLLLLPVRFDVVAPRRAFLSLIRIAAMSSRIGSFTCFDSSATLSRSLSLSRLSRKRRADTTIATRRGRVNSELRSLDELRAQDSWETHTRYYRNCTRQNSSCSGGSSWRPITLSQCCLLPKSFGKRFLSFRLARVAHLNLRAHEVLLRDAPRVCVALLDDQLLLTRRIRVACVFLRLSPVKCLSPFRWCGECACAYCCEGIVEKRTTTHEQRGTSACRPWRVSRS